MVEVDGGFAGTTVARVARSKELICTIGTRPNPLAEAVALEDLDARLGPKPLDQSNGIGAAPHRP